MNVSEVLLAFDSSANRLSEIDLLVPIVISSSCSTQEDSRCEAISEESICDRVTKSCQCKRLRTLILHRVSLFYLIGLFDLWSGIQTLAISSVGAYAIASYVQGPMMPWYGFIFLMGHMSISHIYRQIVNAPSTVDITGAQMVLVMKLTAFCWNVYDGRLSEKDLVEFQKNHLIKEMPDLLSYTAWVLFFPSLFAGPAFDYIDYEQWLQTSMFELPPGTDPTQAPRVRKNRKIPRSGTPATIKALQGLGWIFLFLKMSAWYNNDVVLGDEFTKYGFLRRVWTLQMLGFTTRLKYYGVWFLTEGACILTGLGYKGIDPKTGKVNWNRLQNVNPMGIELAQNSRAYLENWNMNTNKWLRNYVYLRVTPKGKKPGFRASLATFGTSAFWHGFYPGYYLSFIFAAFIQTEAKNFRRHVRPFFLSKDGSKGTAYKPVYDFATYFVTQIVFCFTTAPFVLLNLPDCIRVWSRVYFYAIILVLSSLAFFASPARAILNKQLRAYQGPQHATAAQQNITSKSKPQAVNDAEEDNNGPALQRTASLDSLSIPILGMPDDPRRAIEEAVAEIRAEVESRRRRGSVVGMPQGEDLVRAVEGRLGVKFDALFRMGGAGGGSKKGDEKGEKLVAEVEAEKKKEL